MRTKKEQNIKIVLILLTLLTLDVIKPFHYLICAEFLFLGVIITALNYPFFFASTLSIIFGYLKDVLSWPPIPLNLVEFSLLTILIHSALLRFNKKLARIIIVLTALIIHIILNTLNTGRGSALFIASFFVQSLLVYPLLNNLLRKWVKHSSVEYI